MPASSKPGTVAVGRSGRPGVVGRGKTWGHPVIGVFNTSGTSVAKHFGEEGIIPAPPMCRRVRKWATVDPGLK